MRRIGTVRARALLVTASLLGATVAVGSSGGNAAAADVAPLAISGFDDIVAGPQWGALFISQGLSGDGVVVTDAEGQEQLTLADTAGSRHLALSHDGTMLWVALADAGEIAGFSTDTFIELARYTMPAGVCPGSVAETLADMSPTGDGTDVRTLLAVGHACNQWGSGASSAGGVGVFDPATGTFEALTYAQPTHRPIVASSPGTGDLFVAGDLGISPTRLVSVTSIGGFPDTVAVQTDTGSNLVDLVVSPDGANVVQASGYPYQHNSYSMPFLDPATVYPSTNYPNAAAVSADGSRVASGTNSSYGDDVRIHDTTTGATLRSVDLSPALLAPGGLAFAPDGSVVYAVVTIQGGFGLAALTEAPEALMSLVVPAEMTFGVSFAIDGRLTFDAAGVTGLDVEVTRHATGTAPVVVGVAQTDAAGSFRIVDDASQAGPVTYEARFLGTDDLPAASAQASLSVLYETDMAIVAPQTVTTGEAFEITGDLQLGAGGPLAGAEIRVERSLPGTSSSEALPSVVTEPDGTFVFTDTLADPGTVTYEFWYDGDAFRYPSSASAYVAAQAGIDTMLTIDAPATADVNEYFGVAGTLTAADGRSTEGAWVLLVRSDVNGTDLYAGETTVDAGGSWTMSTAIDVAGPAELTAHFYGNDFFDPASASTTVEIVTPPAPLLSVDLPVQSDAGEPVRASGQLTDSSGAPLAGRSVEITQTDGVTGWETYATVVTTSNGAFHYDFTPVAAGSQIVTARYFDGGASPVVTKSAEVIVLTRPTAINATAPSSVPAGDPVVVTGALTDQRSSGAVGGATVVVTRSLGGAIEQLGSVTTASDGSFTIVDVPGATGTATYDLSFHGSDVFGASAGNVSVEIVRQESSISVTATPLTGKKSRGKYTIAADFTDGGPARSMALYARTPAGESLIASGATISIVVQPSETTTFVARFAGDAQYEASEAAVTVTVSKKGGGKPKR